MDVTKSTKNHVNQQHLFFADVDDGVQTVGMSRQESEVPLPDAIVAICLKRRNNEEDKAKGGFVIHFMQVEA